MGKFNKSLFKKLVEGPERSDDYARNKLPSNRWALGWDLIKINMGKIIKINLLLILFLFPLALLFYLRELMLAGNSLDSPFSQNLGVGYPIYPIMSGIRESIIYQTDLMVIAILFVLVLYLCVGISGGFYVMRNMVWTEGVFVISDFWRGVKKNYKNTLILTLIYILFVAITLISIDATNYQLAIKTDYNVLYTIMKIISYVALSIFTIVYLFSLTINVTYELSLFKIIKNAFIYTIAMLPINVFFVLLSAVPFALLLFNPSSIIFSIGLIMILFMSISISILIWTNYSQWVFDETINSRVAGAKRNRGITKKNAKNQTEEFVYEKSEFKARNIKPITDDEIEIVELPTNYSRADLIRLEESKKKMIEDSDKYADEHKNDPPLSDIDEFMKGELDKDE